MEKQLDFDGFVEAVKQVELEDANLVHEAAHSSAVSTRDWSKTEQESR